jgi:hypothetical protein
LVASATSPAVALAATIMGANKYLLMPKFDAEPLMEEVEVLFPAILSASCKLVISIEQLIKLKARPSALHCQQIFINPQSRCQVKSWSRSADSSFTFELNLS